MYDVKYSFKYANRPFAYELKDQGFKVFAIHPGWVRSYIIGELWTEAEVEPLVSAQGIYEQITKAFAL